MQYGFVDFQKTIKKPIKNKTVKKLLPLKHNGLLLDKSGLEIYFI